MHGKAEGELWGAVNMLRGLKHPKSHLEGSGGAHTHSHRKGGVGETKCHSVPLQKEHLEGSVGGTRGSGMQHKTGRGSWGTATASSVPRGFLGTPGAGLWPWGSGSQAEKPGCVPGDEQQPLSRSAGHPTLWKLSLGVSRAAGPSWGRSQQLLPSKGCFPALLVAVLPRCCWGDPSECLVSAVCSSQSSVCSVPAAILCCCQQHLNLPNCCKPPLQH